ncbi:SIR2 family NAD-dependent protein deacylase [Natranaerofaba carboxydovora]|uniref:SIR2 family NAD-dependent protein deacylase n=1 Tax=Natranaerofaba carboxydovora TaxID=2742683 RepID=UPI001F130BAC|nr:Sir2 family NAD-dependent protein deacetylase [Natranaerofaba carboxydovora]UMZ74169.1 NAD-dependent protein deacetylase [Natranaerofaba carboxydovora]
MELEKEFEKAAQVINRASAIIVNTGAGMGVDSGLPDFRGKEGFWKAYPLYKRLGINFMDAANPAHFSKDPSFGWGFYGHRVNLYRKTEPHEGYKILKDWIREFGLDYFIATSNVDGQFQKASYPDDKIFEVHGSIHHLQCVRPCSDDIWDNDEEFEIDKDSMRSNNVPLCPNCGGTARPNILMFGDFSWVGERSGKQEDRFRQFLDEYQDENIAVIEIGAGTAVPTIRNLSERIARSYDAAVIRVNPREYHISPPHISIACGGLEGLEGINNYLQERGK